MKWEIDSPAFIDLSTTHQDIVRYLIDVRDCIVHFRTFATSDNTVAIEDSFPEEKIPDLGLWSDRPVTRVVFRRLGGVKVVVNVLLPDAIRSYLPDGTRGPFMFPFTYTQGYNLLTQSREFARLCTSSVLRVLADNVTGESYHLKKRTAKR